MKKEEKSIGIVKTDKIPMKKTIKASGKFVVILALVSIVGFIGVISETLFSKDITLYVEAFWMIIVGIGFIVESQPKSLARIRIEGLTPANFTHLITAVFGVLALVAGFFSLPNVRIESTGFVAVKGIIALISIIVIIVQTWIIE